MKRFLAIVLNLGLMMSFVACAAKPTAVMAPVASGSKELKGTITFSTWGSLDEKKVNEDIIAEFEKDYPGTKVDLEFIPDGYIQKIETMFVGGTAPDVIYGHPYYFANWASKGLLMDLDARFELDSAYFMNDKFASQMYDSFKWNGKHIATINGHDTFLLFYNKDMFDKAGVAYPNDDWTWDDFVAAGQKLTKLEGNDKQYGFTVASWPVFVNAFIYSFGGSMFDSMDHPTKVTFDNPNTVAALKFLQDLIFTYKIAPTVQDSQQLGGSFDTGKVAMDITGMWAVVSRKNITDFKWDVANLPLVKGQPRKTAALYAGYAIYKDTKNPDLAWEFAKYFQSDKAQRLLSGLGLITVINKNIASSEEVIKAPGMPEHHVLRVSSIDYAINGHAFLTNLDEINTKGIQPSYDQLFANTMDPATAATTIQTNLEKLLGEAGQQK